MNAFKTVRRNLASSNSSTAIAYKTKEANFNLAVDFPSLSSSSSSNATATATTTTNSTIDYSHTFTPAPVPDIIPNPDIKNILEPRIPPPGWHKYSWNKSTRIMTADYGKGAGPYANAAPANDEHIQGQHFIKMMNRLEETQLSHAEQFIECYGYDCYEHTFLMPHYSPQYFSDSDYSDGSNSDHFASDDEF